MNEGRGWKDESLVSTYLEGIKDGMPSRDTQYGIMLHLIESSLGSAGREVTGLLDIGAGDGALASVILNKYPEARAVLVDFSAPMLRAARTCFKGSGYDVEIVEADISKERWLASPGVAGPFDVIVSSYAIHHLTDERKRALYKEIYGLLAPGGIFINIDRVLSLSNWAGEAAGEYLAKTLRLYHDERGTPELYEKIEARLEERDAEKSDILAPVEAQCEWLREVGFTDVECYFKAFEHALFGGRRPKKGAALFGNAG